MTLEDLSAATGMTARNVRAYQTKGLLPPPARQGRRSVYGTEHLRRLRAIERARAHGASLSLIASHLAQGRALDGDALVEWPAAGPPPAAGRPPDDAEPPGAAGVPGGAGLPGDAGSRSGPADRPDVKGLLRPPDRRRDPTTRRQVDLLVRAGVLERRPHGLHTGHELATALSALQQLGLPVQVTLGVAERALAAAEPVAVAARAGLVTALAGTADAAAAADRLGEVAGYVVRHVVASATPP